MLGSPRNISGDFMLTDVWVKTPQRWKVAERPPAIINDPTGQFSATTDCANALPSGATCHVAVTFTPKAAGLQRANLQINDDAAGSPQLLNLSGSGS